MTPDQIARAAGALARARREGPDVHASWRELFDKTFI